MTSLASRKSPTSPNLSTRPSTAALGHPQSRPQTPSGLREVTNSSSSLEPPSGVAYRAFISTWTDGHVAQWLTDAKVAKVAPTFRSNHIRGDVVLDLDQNVLKEMGIVSVGDRIKIMSAVKALRQRCSRPTAAYGIGGANVLNGGPRLMLNNNQEASLSSSILAGSRSGRVIADGGPPPQMDISPANNRASGSSSGRRSDRPPPLHLLHSAQRDLPQIISGSSNGVHTPGLAPPGSAKSVMTPRPTPPNQGTQTPSGSGSRSNFPSIPPAPRAQPPAVTSGPSNIPPPSATSSRSNRSLHPSHGRDTSQSHPSYTNEPLPPPPSATSAVAAWQGEYGLPRGPAPGNLPGGAYAPTSGRASPQPHSRAATSRSNQTDPSLTHKKSGSLGNIISGLKGNGWSTPASNHPYATASPAVESTSSGSSQYSNSPAMTEGFHPTGTSAGYAVKRGPYHNASGRMASGHHSQQSGGGHGNPLSLEDLRRRTIKINLGEIGQSTKQTRTIDISECDSGAGVLHAALRKFGKGGGLGHKNGDDSRDVGDFDGGGLVVDGWGVFLEGVLGASESNVKPLTEAELLTICHADAANPIRDRLTLRRVRNKGSGKLNAFFGEQPPPPPLQVSPTSPNFSSHRQQQSGRYDDTPSSAGFNTSLTVPGKTSPPPARPNAGSKKMYRASTVSIMSGLGVANAFMGIGNYSTPPVSAGGTQLATSVSMVGGPTNEIHTPTSAQNMPGRSPVGKRLRNFFGQRPPSDIIYTHQQDFFPAAEKKVLERTATARQSMFKGPNSKRISTVSALSNVGIGGSDDGGRKSWRGHRSGLSVSSNGSVPMPGMTPAQSLAAANNPNIPPVPSPTLPTTSHARSAPMTKSDSSIEESLPRMSVSTEDGKSIDLTSDEEEDLAPPTATPASQPLLLPPVALDGETLTQSLSADFRASFLSIQPSTTAQPNKRTSFLQELRSRRDKSDTASMLTLDEITEKVESRRQSMMGTSFDNGSDGDDGAGSLAPSRRQSTYSRHHSMAVDEEEDEDEEEEETTVEEEEYEDEEGEEEEEGEEDGDRKVTSTGDKRVIKWIKGALIGAGSFGSVYLGMDAQHGLLMAVKQVQLPTGKSANEERKKSMLSALEREIALLKELQHEYIVQYLDSSIDDQHLNIFLEYVPGGSVATLLRNYGAFEESLTCTWVKQILTGLNYLHERDIVHRDIKGANILVDNRGGIKISDFGISKKMEDVSGARGHRASLQGSVFWMAPEVVKQSGQSSKADIWSVGCVVVEMLTGDHPFPKASQMQAIFRIGSCAKPDTPPDISPEAEDFLNKTFEIDHTARPSAAELLKHPWLPPEASIRFT